MASSTKKLASIKLKKELNGKGRIHRMRPFFFRKISAYYHSFPPQFWLLCLCSFLYFFSFNFIIPQLSEVLTNLGGAEYKGLIFGLFATSALISRPFSGKLIDLVGRKQVILIGILIAIAVTSLYPLAYTALGFLLLRFAHGFSAGFTPTGTTGSVADLVSVNKRGEAMGLLGMLNNVGFSLGPAFGSEVALASSNQTVFLVSAFIGVLALLPFFWLNETKSGVSRFNLSMLKIKIVDLFEPLVKVQGLVMILTVITFGSMITLIPDISKSFGILRPGLVFTAITIPSIVMRIFSGKWSDKYGRERLMLLGIAILIVSNILMIVAYNAESLYFAAIIFGLSTGINSPTIFAWVIDKANSMHLGRAISTLFICLELGIIIGSVASASLFNNDISKLKYAFIFCAFSSVLALVTVAREHRKTDVSYL
jgi:MFS family permease